MLDPERAVLVEGGDALRRRDEIRRPYPWWSSTKSTMACLAGPSFHEGSGSWAFAAGGTTDNERQHGEG